MINYKENGQINMEALEIADVADISLLQKFQDNFAVSVNCASVTVDRHGAGSGENREAVCGDLPCLVN